MTPAIKALQQAGIAYELAEYDVSHISGDYGQAASQQLGLDAALIFKTLVAQADQQYIVAIVPTAARLDWKKTGGGRRRQEGRHGRSRSGTKTHRLCTGWH